MYVKPKRLKPDELNCLLIGVASGSAQDLNRIYCCYRKAIDKSIHNYERDYSEDATQDGLKVALEAIRSYKMGSKYSLGTHISSKIRTFFSHAREGDDRRLKVIIFSQLTEDDLLVEDEQYENIAKHIDCETLLSRLTEEERNIVELHFGLSASGREYSIRDIATLIDQPKTNVARILQESIKKIQKLGQI
jgi:RNA polymerase sigma factor (sigma-70 family)